MVQYQKGEVRAFEVLLTRHRKPVYNFILRFVGDRETAEDVLQEVFMRVIKGAEAYKRQAKFTTWLYTIARNLCVDQTRRRKHRKHASLDAPMDSSDESGTLMDVIPSNEMASDRKRVNKQLHETMQRAIAALSDEQREVFLMRVPRSAVQADRGRGRVRKTRSRVVALCTGEAPARARRVQGLAKALP
jgi:RNA polymerase sigma-70 factor (ECF subfamily)